MRKEEDIKKDIFAFRGYGEGKQNDYLKCIAEVLVDIREILIKITNLNN